VALRSRTKLGKADQVMTTAAASSTTTITRTSTKKWESEANPAYRTTTSFAAVRFDEAGKGRIVFLPYGATFRVIGLSSCLPEGVEVMFNKRLYNIFEVDVLARCTPIREPIRAKSLAIGACA
jgi:hypothetical protein